MFRSSRGVVISFLLAIVVGAIVLLSVERAGGHPISIIDALFTATSAVCVTGLIVLDTGSDFSIPGQVVILVMIQVGGIGIMAFSNFLLLVTGRRLSLSENQTVEQAYGKTAILRPAQMIRRIVYYTFTFEAVGAFCFWLRFRSRFSAGEAIFQSIFHAVSAFCNAGFSLFSDSFIRYSDDPFVNLVLMTLIVLGGLGFVLFSDLLTIPKKTDTGQPRRRLSLHSRTVLITTALLIAVGTLLVYFLERPNTLSGTNSLEKLISSMFLSITSRTAGFNTLDTSALSSCTLVIVVMLMAIGASPGSTGGGIKTTTFAALCAVLWSQTRGFSTVRLMNRKLPPEIVVRALAIFALFLIMTVFATVFLLLAEEYGEAHGRGDYSFLAYLFEVVSALGTVGLSMGVTPTLSFFGKVVIILSMFVGRLGPLVIASSLIASREGQTYELPEEGIMVG